MPDLNDIQSEVSEWYDAFVDGKSEMARYGDYTEAEVEEIKDRAAAVWSALVDIFERQAAHLSDSKISHH